MGIIITQYGITKLNLKKVNMLEKIEEIHHIPGIRVSYGLGSRNEEESEVILACGIGNGNGWVTGEGMGMGSANGGEREKATWHELGIH